MVTRRNFLHTLAGSTALASLPLSIQKALAIPANNKTGTIHDVEHVVILMQENRSFDHYFGTLAGVRGFSDRMTIPVPNQPNIWHQIRKNGSTLTPYHLNGDYHNAQRAGGTPHTWVDTQLAWDNGRMTHWPEHKHDVSMGYYKEKEIPFQFALANAFTICDAYHCSIHTGTDANRSFHLTGTNGALPSNRAYVNNEWSKLDGNPKTVNIGYTWTTYAERLEKAGIQWICYQNMPDEWGDNMLGSFVNFKKANIASGFPVSSGESANTPYYPNKQPLPYHAYDRQYPYPDPLYKGIANTLPGTSPENYLDAFKRDIKEDNLPQVSWINAPAIYCEHPGPSSPVQGAWFIQEILDALTAVPEVWSKTVLIVNFDENDGYFDHVPPPSAPSKIKNNQFAGKSTLSEQDMSYEYYSHQPPAGSTEQPAADNRVYGPGPRVPLYVVSPWSKGGWVNSETFDHTSILMFLEERFGVIESNISPFRRAICGNLTSAFNFKTPNTESVTTLSPKITRLQADQFRKIQETLPSVPLPEKNSLPIQNKGIKLSRKLPYELHTSITRHPNHVELFFKNTGSQGAVYHVYDKLNLDKIPRRYVVEAGKEISDIWDVMLDNSGHYNLWVLGPNAYHRHFVGNVQNLSEINPEVEILYDKNKKGIQIQFTNKGNSPLHFNLLPLAYQNNQELKIALAPGKHHKQFLNLEKTAHWYDFLVTLDNQDHYSQRFAGRMETSFDSISDPALA